MAQQGWNKILLFSFLLVIYSGKTFAQCGINTVPAGFDCTGGDAINSVQFASVTTANTGCNDPIDAHTYFTTPVRNVVKGQTYSFTTSYDFFDQHCGIWIDFDNNGFFDTYEAVFLSTSTLPAAGHSGNITIPFTAVTGVVRMRVRSDGWYRFANNEACVGFSDGETEDYDINIQAPPPLDIAATLLTSPTEFNCGGTFPVIIQIQNFGGNTLDFSTNNVTVSASVTGPNPQVFTPVVISSGTLAPAGTLNVQVSASYAMTLQGTYTFAASATTPGDGNTGNDAMPNMPINISNQNVFPAVVDFSSLPNPPYQLQQVAGTGNWTILSGSMTNPTLAPVIGTGMAYFDSYNFSAGTTSRLISPCYNFTNLCAPLYEFWMSQDAQFVLRPDSVAVKVSTDGGQTYSSSLLTATRLNISYSVPGWRLFSVPLTAYAGQNNIRIALEGRSEWGNSIGVDAIIVREDTMARLSGNTSICPGNTANLTVNFTGTAPFTLTYTNGVTPTTVTGVTSNPFIITVTPASSTTYSLTSVQNACGTGLTNGNAVVTIMSPPTSNITGTQTICQGSSTLLSVAFTGLQPWNLSWTDGTNTNNINGINTNPFTISVTPTGTTTYSITALSDQLCNGTSFTGNPVVTTVPPPTATISGSTTICPGFSTNLAVVLTGLSPWSFTYTDGVSPQTHTGITNAIYTFSVTPVANTTYTLTNVTNNCGAGTVGGSAVVTLSNIATATLSGGQTICTGGSAQLSIGFSGASPWDVTYTNGVSPVGISGITANPYTFTVTPAANTTYTLTQMANPCGSGLVSGSAVVQINPNPAGIISGPSSVCAGNTVSLSISLTGSNPWNITYSDGTTVQNATGITTSPYVITETPLAGNTYSLNSITDAFNCNATNMGAPLSIQVNDIATVSLASDQTICGALNATLTVTLVSGSLPYDLDWSDGSITTTVTGITSNTNLINITPSVTTTYSLVSTTNLCGVDNPGVQAVITIMPGITASLSATSNVCAGNGTNLTFNISGSGPFDITYTDGVTQSTETGVTDNPYELSVTPVINNSYDIVTVTDANGCSIGGGTPVSITVDSLPSASISGSLTLCAGASSGILVYFTGSGPYDLDYDDGSSIVSIPGITNNPYLIPSGTTGGTTNYTLTGVMNAQCGSGLVTGSGSITVIDEPTSLLSGGGAVCGSNTTTLTLNFTGQAPWFISYTDGASNYSAGNIMSSPYVFTVTPSVNPANYSLLSLSDAACINGVRTGSAIVNLGQAPNATMSGNNSVCSGGNLNLTFNLTGTPPYTVTYTDGTTPVTVMGINTNPYIHTVNPLAATTYTLTGASDQFCSNNNLTYILPVSVTPLPTASFTPVLVYGGQITLFNNSLYGTTYLWDFGDMSGTSAGFQPTHTYAANGVYTIILTVTNGCGSASASQTITISSVSSDADWEALQVKIYPNPSEGLFTVQIPFNSVLEGQMEMHDLQGKKVWSSRLNAGPDAPENRVDVRNQLSKGVYILTVQVGDQTGQYKITID